MNADSGVRARSYRVYVLGLLVAVGIVGWVDRNVFAVLLQSMKVDLALSDTQLGLLGGAAFGVFYATVGLPVAWLADRYSRSTLIAVALGLWSVMTAACGLAGGFGSLFLARIGVGIGEAGGSPPSQSLIADYFPPARRARALGVLYLYIPCGFVVGYLSGGWLNDLVGWRLTFILVGLPGVLLALVVRFTLLEPPRGHAERAPAGDSVPSLASTLRHFLSCPALRHLPLAGALHGIGAFAAALWLPAYFVRTFGVTSGTAGAWMALAYGCGGGIGVLCGGHVADALVRRTGDSRWYAWGAAGALVATLPCTLLVYLSEKPLVAVTALVAATLLGHTFLGPVSALLQELAGVRRRATAAAFYLFLVNIVSMGLGPTAVGIASDYFGARFGDDALRYALLAIVATTTVLASTHFMLAARSLSRDLEIAGRAAPHAAD
jgi:MFS family permease